MVLLAMTLVAPFCFCYFICVWLCVSVHRFLRVSAALMEDRGSGSSGAGVAAVSCCELKDTTLQKQHVLFPAEPSPALLL